jgi:hypothetical protein
MFKQSKQHNESNLQSKNFDLSICQSLDGHINKYLIFSKFKSIKTCIGAILYK